MSAPLPLDDGLYWYKKDDGEWSPMIVEGGRSFPLDKYIESGADSHTQLVDTLLSLKGPLARPKS